MLILKSKNGLPLRGGDVVQDFRGKDWKFLYLTNGPISHGKVVVASLDDESRPDIREFFPSVFPDTFIVELYRKRPEPENTHQQHRRQLEANAAYLVSVVGRGE